MLVSIVYLSLGLVNGWVAFRNGPTRFGRWTDELGKTRYGGALSLLPALMFFAIGVVRLSRHI